MKILVNIMLERLCKAAAPFLREEEVSSRCSAAALEPWECAAEAKLVPAPAAAASQSRGVTTSKKVC